MALEVGIVDLDHDHPQEAVRVAAEVEAGRVEDVAQDAEVGHQRDAPASGVDALAIEVLADGAVEIAGRHGQVVGVAEGDEAASVAPDEPRPARDLVELAQVEREVEDVVLELVDERLEAAMPDRAFEEMGPHAARSSRSATSASATSKPERQPSSWKP